MEEAATEWLAAAAQLQLVERRAMNALGDLRVMFAVDDMTRPCSAPLNAWLPSRLPSME